MNLRDAAIQAIEVMQKNQYAVADQAPHKDVMAYNAAIVELADALNRPQPGIVNLEDYAGFVYESKKGWHTGDMKVVKWLLDNREADYWDQFKEEA